MSQTHDLSRYAFMTKAWEAMPAVVTTAPQSGASWRTTLSRALSTQASLEADPVSAGGVVSSADRGILALIKLTLEPQDISVKPDSDGPAELRVAIILKGAITFTSHAHRRRYVCGEIFVLSPMWDAYRIQTEEVTEAVVIQIPVWWLLDGRCDRDSLGWLGAQHLAIPRDFFLSPVIFSATEALLQHVGSPEHLTFAQNLLAAALTQTLSAAAPTPEVTGVNQQSRFTRIYNYVMVNIADEDLSPASTAKAMKISVRTLHQTCADNSATFGGMVTEMRMTYAAYLLRSGSAHVSEVAFSVGFRSLSHFCRLFKNRFGVSARQYRMSAIA